MTEQEREVIQQAIDALEKAQCSAKHEQDCDVCNAIEALRATLTAPAVADAAPQPVIPEDWALVPVEPTPEMLQAGRDEPLAGTDDDDSPEDYRQVFRAMLAAAPQPAQVEPLTDAQIDDAFRRLHAPVETPWANWRNFAHAIEQAHGISGVKS